MTALHQNRKKRLIKTLIPCFIILIILIIVIHAFWQDFYGAGTVGTCENINDIPYLDKEFLGFKCTGPFKYVYKIMHRTTNYMFTGKTTETEFLKFCTPEQDWTLLIFDTTTTPQKLSYNFHKVTPLDFPICDHGDFYACKIIEAINENQGGAMLHIYFRKKDNTFTATVVRNHIPEDWDQ